MAGGPQVGFTCGDLSIYAERVEPQQVPPVKSLLPQALSEQFQEQSRERQSPDWRPPIRHSGEWRSQEGGPEIRSPGDFAFPHVGFTDGSFDFEFLIFDRRHFPPSKDVQSSVA
jgi:hypothetical protein